MSADFETHPIGTALRIKELEQQRNKLIEALELIKAGSTPAKFIAKVALSKVKP